MDLVIFIILLVIIIFWKKSFSNFIYFLAITDMFLRIFTFIKSQITISEVYKFLNSLKIPSSISGIIDAYSSGIFNTILIYGYVICMCIFLFYVIRTFLKKR